MKNADEKMHSIHICISARLLSNFGKVLICSNDFENIFRIPKNKRKKILSSYNAYTKKATVFVKE